MTGAAINRISIVTGFFMGLLSSVQGLITGGDIFFVIIERFFITFAASALLIWIALTIINSVIIGAARGSAATKPSLGTNVAAGLGGKSPLSDMLNKARKEASSKGLNLDFTSEPQEDMLGLDNLFEGNGGPEVREFQPFKPRKLGTDRDDTTE